MQKHKKEKPKPMTLYPLKFEEVISDVLKIKPEPKKRARKPKLQARKDRQRTKDK